MTSQRFISNFRINKIFSYLVSFAGFHSTKFTLVLASFFLSKHFHFFLSSSLNRLNTLSTCHKLESIGNAQNLSSSFICRDKHSTPTSLIKVLSMKVGVYLILHERNTLFTDPTKVTNEWKVKCKNL